MRNLPLAIKLLLIPAGLILLFLIIAFVIMLSHQLYGLSVGF